MNQQTNIVAVGDLAGNRSDPDSIFDLVKPEIQAADFAFGQIEAVYSKKGHLNVSGTSSPLRGDPENVAALARAGFNIASLASNHCMDYGVEGFLDMLEQFKSNNIKIFGAGAFDAVQLGAELVVRLDRKSVV